MRKLLGFVLAFGLVGCGAVEEGVEYSKERVRVIIEGADEAYVNTRDSVVDGAEHYAGSAEDGVLQLRDFSHSLLLAVRDFKHDGFLTIRDSVHDGVIGIRDGVNTIYVDLRNGVVDLPKRTAAGLEGDDGKDGADGSDGSSGSDGAQGIQGEQGEKGEKGRRGKKGADGQDGAAGNLASCSISKVPEPHGKSCEVSLICDNSYTIVLGTFRMQDDECTDI